MFGSIREGQILETRPLISFLAVVKTILLICVLVGDATLFSWIYLTCCFTSAGFLLFWIIWPGILNPIYPYSLNFIRTGSYVCGLYGCALALAIHPDQQGYALLTGAIVIELVAYGIGHCISRSKDFE